MSAVSSGHKPLAAVGYGQEPLAMVSDSKAFFPPPKGGLLAARTCLCAVTRQWAAMERDVMAEPWGSA